MTQVAKESISATGATASEFISSAPRRVSPRRPTPPRDPSSYLSKGIGSTSRSLPLAATTTELHVTSNSSDTGSGKRDKVQEVPAARNDPNDDAKPESSNESRIASEERSSINEEQNGPTRSSADILDAEDKLDSGEKVRDAFAGWMGWFLRPSNNTEQVPTATRQSAIEQASHDRGANNADAAAAAAGGTDSSSKDDSGSGIVSEVRRSSDLTLISPTTHRAPAPRSWLSLWNYAAPPAESEVPVAAPTKSNVLPRPMEAANPDNDNSGKDDRILDLASKAQEQPAEAGKSYGWAFWTKEPSNSESTGTARGASVDALALAGSSSKSKSETAEVDETKIASKPMKNEKPRSLRFTEGITTASDGKDSRDKPAKSGAAALSTQLDKSEPPLAKSKESATNLLLPPLELTYRTAEKSGLLQHLGQFLQFKKPPLKTRHVHLQDPPRIKRALAIVSTLHKTTSRQIENTDTVD